MLTFRSDLKDKKPVVVNVPHKTDMMCLNESTLNLWKTVQDAALRKLDAVPLNRYFNPITDELLNRLSDYAGVPQEWLAMGNGADEMLYYLFVATRQDAASFAVSAAPSYFDYKSYTSAVGMGIKLVDFTPDYRFPLAAYLDACDHPDCRLVILCNPNNPTGHLLDASSIEAVIQANRHKLVLIDETYYEFSGVTWKDRLDEYPNLVLVRSFSKGFSAAGLRFGYCIARPEVINELKKVMTAFHLSLLTQATVCAMLHKQELFMQHNARVKELKEQLYASLDAIEGMTVHPSATNFLTFSLGQETAQLFEYLNNHEIAVRAVWAHPVLANTLRVTVGTAEQNMRFIECVKKFVKTRE
jgi:histidinol-phosphate aminotransferase